MATATRRRTQANDKSHYLNIKELILADWMEALDEFDPDHEIIENPEALFPQIIDLFLHVPRKLTAKSKPIDIEREKILRLFHDIFVENIEACDLFEKRKQELNAIAQAPLSNARSSTDEEPYTTPKDFLEKEQQRLDRLHADRVAKWHLSDYRNSTAVAVFSKALNTRFESINLDADGLVALNALNLFPFAKIIRDEDFLIELFATQIVDTDPEFEPLELDIQIEKDELFASTFKLEDYRKNNRLDFLLGMVDIYHQSQRDTLEALEDIQKAKELEKQVENDTAIGIEAREIKPTRREIRNNERRLAIEERRRVIEESIARAEQERLAVQEAGREKANDRRLRQQSRPKPTPNTPKVSEAELIAKEMREKSDRVDRISKMIVPAVATNLIVFHALGTELNYLRRSKGLTTNQKILEGYNALFREQTIWNALAGASSEMGLRQSLKSDEDKVNQGLKLPVKFTGQTMLAKILSISAESILLMEVVNNVREDIAHGKYPSLEQIEAIESIFRENTNEVDRLVSIIGDGNKIGQVCIWSNNPKWDLLIDVEKYRSEFPQFSDRDLEYLSEVLCLPIHGVLFYAKDNLEKYQDFLENRAVAVNERTGMHRNCYGIAQIDEYSVVQPHGKFDLPMEDFVEFCAKVDKDLSKTVEDIKAAAYALEDAEELEVLFGINEMDCEIVANRDMSETNAIIVPLLRRTYVVCTNAFLLNDTVSLGTTYRDDTNKGAFDLQNRVGGKIVHSRPLVMQPYERWTSLGKALILSKGLDADSMRPYHVTAAISSALLDVYNECIHISAILEYHMISAQVPEDFPLEDLLLDANEIVSGLEAKINYLESLFEDFSPDASQFNYLDKVWQRVMSHDHMYEGTKSINEPLLTPNIIERFTRKFHLHHRVAGHLLADHFKPQLLLGTKDESYEDKSARDIARTEIIRDLPGNDLMDQMAFEAGTQLANIFGVGNYGPILFNSKNGIMPQMQPPLPIDDSTIENWLQVSGAIFDRYVNRKVRPDDFEMFKLINTKFELNESTYTEMMSRMADNRDSTPEAKIMPHQSRP